MASLELVLYRHYISLDLYKIQQYEYTYSGSEIELVDETLLDLTVESQFFWYKHDFIINKFNFCALVLQVLQATGEEAVPLQVLDESGKLVARDSFTFDANG